MAAQSAFVCQLCDQKSVMWKCEECGIFLCSTCKVKIHPRLKSSEKHMILSIKDIWKNNEPWYHGKMTRAKADTLLQKYKYMGDGAFLVRESATNIGSYALDYLINGEPVRIRILTKEDSGQLKYYTTGDECMFDSLSDFIEELKNTQSIRVHNDVRCEEITITEPIPKETRSDK